MARNTRNQIADAVKRLILIKQLDSITIQELTDEANINKKTFYYHFHGMSDLLDWMYSNMFYETIGENGINTNNWMDLMIKLMALVRENAVYISATMRSDYGAHFIQTVSGLTEFAMEIYIQNQKEAWEKEQGRTLQLSATKMDYLVKYHSRAFYGIAEQWFFSGMTLSDVEIAEIYRTISNDSIRTAFELMSHNTVQYLSGD